MWCSWARVADGFCTIQLHDSSWSLPTYCKTDWLAIAPHHSDVIKDLGTALGGDSSDSEVDLTKVLAKRVKQPVVKEHKSKDQQVNHSCIQQLGVKMLSSQR